jgi:hypothetical protein
MLRMTPPELFAQFGRPMPVMDVRPDPDAVKATRQQACVVMEETTQARVYRAVLDARQLSTIRRAFMAVGGWGI